MKRNVLTSLLIIALLFIGVGGQLAGTEQSHAYASSPTSYGMWEFLATTADVHAQQPCINWYMNSNFDWIVMSYWGASGGAASKVSAGGKNVIMETDMLRGSIAKNHYTWTDIYNSLRGNKSIYNEALGYAVAEINEVGAGNLYAVTLGEENPEEGYGYNFNEITSTTIGYFIACHNQMYDDLKALYPNLKIFADVHIDLLTDNQLTTLKRDGIVDDEYDSNLNTMQAWFSRMVQLGGAETYCIVYASSNYASWTDLITPSVVQQTAELAESLGVPHLGWFAYDFSTSPHSTSILFNNWPACADPNDSHCSGNYKDTILSIVNTAQRTPKHTPTPTSTPTPTPTSTPTPTPTSTPTPTPLASVAQFGATTVAGDSPLGVQFTDQSTGSINSWLWDFGDGATSTAQNPLHTYNSAGVYAVSLTVTGSSIDTEIKSGYISVYITGDVDEDGIVNSTDLVEEERIILGLDPVTSNADVNGDGVINALDLTQIELIIMRG